MSILILVCALSLTAPECQRNTALHEIRTEIAVPDLAGCMRHGMLFAAESGLVTPGTFPKVYCAMPGNRPVG